MQTGTIELWIQHQNNTDSKTVPEAVMGCNNSVWNILFDITISEMCIDI